MTITIYEYFVRMENIIFPYYTHNRVTLGVSSVDLTKLKRKMSNWNSKSAIKRRKLSNWNKNWNLSYQPRLLTLMAIIWAGEMPSYLVIAEIFYLVLASRSKLRIPVLSRDSTSSILTARSTEMIQFKPTATWTQV